MAQLQEIQHTLARLDTKIAHVHSVEVEQVQDTEKVGAKLQGFLKALDLSSLKAERVQNSMSLQSDAQKEFNAGMAGTVQLGDLTINRMAFGTMRLP